MKFSKSISDCDKPSVVASLKDSLHIQRWLFLTCKATSQSLSLKQTQSEISIISKFLLRLSNMTYIEDEFSPVVSSPSLHESKSKTFWKLLRRKLKTWKVNWSNGEKIVCFLICLWKQFHHAYIARDLSKFYKRLHFWVLLSSLYVFFLSFKSSYFGVNKHLWQFAISPKPDRNLKFSKPLHFRIHLLSFTSLLLLFNRLILKSKSMFDVLQCL